MPLPLLFIGIGVATAGIGVGKTAKAVKDNHDAKKINESADHIITSSNNRAGKARNDCGNAIEDLGKEKVYILNESMLSFINNFEKIKNIEFEDSIGLEELRKFHLDKASFDELKQLQTISSSFVGAAAGGAVAGALTAFGAYSAASTFAIASTGTAIGTLSGAAATNATLAFFGGGSLAAGGLGMAGGTVVLGGLVAGPALAIMGFVLDSKAKAALDDARSNHAKAEEFSEQVKVVISTCKGIRMRANMLTRLLLKLDAIFAPLVYNMEKIIETSGSDYTKYTPDQKKTIAGAMALAGAIKAVLDTPLLTEDGSLTPESETIESSIQSVFTDRQLPEHYNA